MDRRRGLAAVVVLAVALVGSAALAPSISHDAGGPAPVGHATTVEPAKAQPGLIPGARVLDERAALVVVAVLATLVGSGATRRRLSRRFRRRTALAAAHLHHLRLRGPPTLQRA